MTVHQTLCFIVSLTFVLIAPNFNSLREPAARRCRRGHLITAIEQISLIVMFDQQTFSCWARPAKPDGT
jgi:hypothetical protein